MPMRAIHKGSFCTLLLGCLSLLPMPSNAQNGYDPPDSLTPTSTAECRELFDAWTRRIEELRQQYLSCRNERRVYCDNVGKSSTLTGDCALVSVNHACGDVTDHWQCIRLGAEWRCAVKRRGLAAADSQEKLRLLDAARQDTEQREAWAREQQQIQIEQQLRRGEQARDYIENEQRRTQSLTDASSEVINIFTKKKDRAPEGSSESRRGTVETVERGARRSAESYAKDVAPMVDVTPAVDAVMMHALISFVPDVRVVMEGKKNVDEKWHQLQK